MDGPNARAAICVKISFLKMRVEIKSCGDYSDHGHGIAVVGSWHDGFGLILDA